MRGCCSSGRRGQRRRAERELDVHAAAQRRAGGHAAIVKLLLEHGADPNARAGRRLHAARLGGAERGRESVDALLEAGAEHGVANDDGKMPAELAGDNTRELL